MYKERWSPSPEPTVPYIPFYPDGPPSSPRKPSPKTFSRWRLPPRGRTLLVFAAIVLSLVYYTTSRKPASRGHAHLSLGSVDWSRYAYSQYATDGAYLCNSLMIFDSLRNLGSRADLILFYPSDWDLRVSDDLDRNSQLLNLAKDKYHVKLIPVEVTTIKRAKHEDGEDNDMTWDTSITKLLAFGETQYDRILHIDSDVTVLQNMDDLFFLPSAPVAMPRAYWSEFRPPPLTSLIVLLEPSYQEFVALTNAISKAAAQDSAGGGPHKYDMEYLNDRYASSALVLPHRPFLLTGEFRSHTHKQYFGNDYEEWDPDKAIARARLVHFSDWPLPKPWIASPFEGVKQLRPKCEKNPGTPQESRCRDREVWLGLYDDFRKRRKDVCKLLSAPAPNWPPRGVNKTAGDG